MGLELNTPDLNNVNPYKSFKVWIKEMPKVRKALLLIIPIVVLANGAISYLLPKGNWQLAGIISMAIVLCGTAFWLFSTFIGVYEKQNEELIRVNKELVKTVGNLADPIQKALIKLPQKTPQYEIATKLDKATEEASKLLMNPKTFYTGIDDYVEGLKDNLKILMGNSNGRVFAVCGDKPWKEQGMIDWFELNVLAISRKVSINRIFLQQKSDISEVAPIMQEQVDRGINVWYALKEEYEKVPFFKEIQEGFGFVIFETENGRKVIMHHYPDKTNSVLWEDQLITSQFKDAYIQLIKNRNVVKIQPTSQLNSDNSAMIFKIQKQANQLKSNIDFLTRHSFSNLQINYLSWRLTSEINKLDQVINDKKINIFALDKFHYLSDVLGNLLCTLKTGDTFRVLSHVEVWGGGNLGIEKLLDQCDTAVEELGANVERIIFIDSNKENDNQYLQKLRSSLAIFNKYGKDTPKYFVVDKNKSLYKELLSSPMAYITEVRGNHRLQINTANLFDDNPKSEPSFNLTFYSSSEKPSQIEIMFNKLFSSGNGIDLLTVAEVATKYKIDIEN